MQLTWTDREIAALMPAALVVAKTVAVLIVAFALTTMMQRVSATARHLVWTASLLALVAIPALALWTPVRFAVLPASWGTPAVAVPAALLDASSRDDNVVSPTPTVQQPQGAQPERASAPPSRVMPATAARLSLRQVIVALWAAVAAALLGWLAFGAVTVRRIVRAATPLDGAEWQGPMMDIADRLALPAVPSLLRSDAITMPFACGFRAPTIVLPADSDAWSDDRRTAVLLHELAHIRRRDIVGHTLGRVVCALYWFNPLVWAAAKRLRSESERACDDLALACGTRASDYAEHLLDIVTSVRRHGTPSVAMAMATRSEFEGRMLAILDPTLVRTAPTRVQASTLAGGVMMFAIVTGSAVPRVVTPSGIEPPRQENGDVRALVTPDTARRDREVRGEDTLTLESGLAPLARGTSGPVAIAVAPVPAKGPVRGADPLASLPAVKGAADSSTRASVLARVLRTDSAASLRRTAAWGLNDYTDQADVVEALVYAVRRDASASVREMAAWSLSDATEQDRVAAALADVIRSDQDLKVRETAVWSLGNGAGDKSTDAINALALALRDDDATVRELAAWGLGNVTPRRAPAALMTALSDRSARVRASAAWALFQIEDADAAPALEAALKTEMDTDARWALVRAIAVMGDRAVEPLQRIIEGSDAAARALAIRALAGHGADPWPQPRPRPRPFP